MQENKCFNYCVYLDDIEILHALQKVKGYNYKKNVY